MLINKNGAVLHTFYESNGGSSLSLSMKILRDIYSKIPPSAYINV
jgi:hypothetical protein